MTEHAQLELIAAGVTCFLSLMAWLKSRANSSDLKELKVTVDGRLTQLLESKDARGAAEAGQARIEGMLAGGVAKAAEIAAAMPPVSAADTAATAAAIQLLATAAATARELLAVADQMRAKTKERDDSDARLAVVRLTDRPELAAALRAAGTGPPHPADPENRAS